MICSNCSNDEDRVTDSRPHLSGYAVWRRRECLVCGARTTTYELSGVVLQGLGLDLRKGRGKGDLSKGYQAILQAEGDTEIPGGVRALSLDSLRERFGKGADKLYPDSHYASAEDEVLELIELGLTSLNNKPPPV